MLSLVKNVALRFNVSRFVIDPPAPSLKKFVKVVLTPAAFAVPNVLTPRFKFFKFGVRAPYKAGRVSNLLKEKSSVSTLDRLACGKSVMFILDKRKYFT